MPAEDDRERAKKETSELVERGTYQAYGGAESDYRPGKWGDFREDYRFTGKEEDVEVGLIYFGKRFYNPLLQRWMSADPLTIHGLGSDLNCYAYVSGAALSAIDPVGLDPESKVADALDKTKETGTVTPYENVVEYRPPPDLSFNNEADAEAQKRRIGEYNLQYAQDAKAYYAEALKYGPRIEGPPQASLDERVGVLAQSTLAATVYAITRNEEAANAAAVVDPINFVPAAARRPAGPPPATKPVRVSPPPAPKLNKSALPKRLDPSTNSGRGTDSAVAPGGKVGEAQLAARGAGRLTSIGSGQWRSSAGLVYGQGSVHGNRVRHVLAHAAPDASKPAHSVFNVARNRVLGLVDEAWAARGSHTIHPSSGNWNYRVDMGRAIGTEGQTAINISVRPGTSEIITAFPVP